MQSNTQNHYNLSQKPLYLIHGELPKKDNVSSETACLNHSYSRDFASEFGIECAVLLQHFQFWIRKNIESGKNNREGRTWMYQTQKEIASFYPYWSRTKVQNIIKKLVELKVLIKGNFNKMKQDRTIWYAFVDQKKFLQFSPVAMQSPNPGNAKPEIGPPIPYNKNNIIKAYKKNNIADPERSLFCNANEKTVSSLPFSPKNYLMRNGLQLSFRTIKLFEKYYDTPSSRERLLRNIQYYEEYCDKGGKPTNHEAYIQACFKNDYANKANLSLQNDLYAQMFKEENNIHKMKILKTVVQFYKEDEIQPISISKELPHASFCATIENFKRYHCL